MVSEPKSLTQGPEHRDKTRVKGAFPVRVRGTDAGGRSFKAISLVDDISASGLYLQLPRALLPGAKLFATVQIRAGLTLAARMTVRRTEFKGHGLSGFGLAFTRTRLLAG